MSHVKPKVQLPAVAVGCYLGLKQECYILVSQRINDFMSHVMKVISLLHGMVHVSVALGTCVIIL